MAQATELMRKVAQTLSEKGSVQVVGLTGEHRDKDGVVIDRTKDRSVMRLYLERTLGKPVSLTHFGASCAYEVVV